MANSAKLREEVIEFYSPELVNNSFGDYEEIWNFEHTARAGILNQSMNRLVENGEIVFDKSKTFLVRTYVKVKDNWRLKWHGKMWYIISITENRFYQDKEIVVNLVEE